MKKFFLSMLIAILTIFTSLIWFQFQYFKYVFKDFNLLESQLLFDDIYSIKSKVSNFYLIKYSDKYLAIDAGDSIDFIKPELQKLSISPQDISHIFLTHTDHDHIGGIKLFTNAKIYISHAEEQMINGLTPRFFFSHNKLDYEYTILKNGETMDFDNHSIKTIFTPGHTPGSASFVVDNKYLFVGDALSIKNNKITYFPRIFTMDLKEMSKSIELIQNINDIRYILTGHFGYLEIK